MSRVTSFNALRDRRLVLVPFLALVVFLASGPRAGASTHPLLTAVYPPAVEAASDEQVVFDRIRAAGAGYVRLTLNWATVAPSPPARPEDPNDPAYHWDAFDAGLQRAIAAGLEPLVMVYNAPLWAERNLQYAAIFSGAGDPDPAAFGAFAQAAAQRYSGRSSGVPRIRLWQVWNEPNISLGYAPQFGANGAVSPDWYRDIVNRFADAVHAANADNVVIAGATAPFFDATADVLSHDSDWGPLAFMRSFLCLSQDLTPSCNATVHFDVWSHHPYTSGGPTHHAVLPNDVSLGDLAEMKQVLDAGVASGHIVSSGPVGFWVTEFSWDSNPPDPLGVPADLEARWVSEALYRMWLNGISLVTWYSLRDLPYPDNNYQSGLYYRGTSLATDRPKPALSAFRFPFVALPNDASHVAVWGRTPAGTPGQVLIEQSSRRRWKALAFLTTDQYGIFDAIVSTTSTKRLRARLFPSHDASIPFSPLSVPDQYFTPFGLPYPLEPVP